MKPAQAMAPPRKVVAWRPTMSVRTPETMLTRKVVPIAREPTRAESQGSGVLVFQIAKFKSWIKRFEYNKILDRAKKFKIDII